MTVVMTPKKSVQGYIQQTPLLQLQLQKRRLQPQKHRRQRNQVREKFAVGKIAKK